MACEFLETITAGTDHAEHLGSTMFHGTFANSSPESKLVARTCVTAGNAGPIFARRYAIPAHVQ